MRRVRDDDIGLARRRDRVRAVEDLFAELPLRPLDFGRTLHLPVLALHLVLGHHHLPDIVAPLKDAVHGGDHDISEHRVAGKTPEHQRHARKDVIDRSVAHREKLRNRRPDDFPDEIPEKDDLDDILQKFEEILLGEYPLDPFRGIQFAHIRLDRIEGEKKTDLDRIGRHADDRRTEHENERMLADHDERELQRFARPGRRRFSDA